VKILSIIGYDLARSPWSTRPLSLFSEVAHLGHEVHMLHFPINGNAPAIHSLADKPFSIEAMNKGCCPFDMPLQYLVNRKKIAKALAGADIVHAMKPVNYIVWMLKNQKRPPLVYDWDDWELAIAEMFYSPRRLARTRRNETFYLDNAELILCANPNIEKQIKNTYGRTSGFTSLPCGVDAELFDPEKHQPDNALRKQLGLGGSPVVFFHGQLEMDTEVEKFLDLVGELANQRNARFLVVGDGRMKAGLMQRAKSLGLEEHVVFTGFVPYNEVPRYLALADVAIALFLDTIYASCKSPLKVYEYMAMARPIVATGVGQIRQLLNDKRGKLVKAEDWPAIKREITSLIDNPKEAQVMGQQARKHILENHTWKHVADKLIKAYQQIINA
jgi:glycosyltransferase involved in cell wall biosynthesis